MRILTRYILGEVLAHGLIGAAVFTFVIFMRDVSRLLELVVRASAPLPSVAEIFFFTLPTALTVTVPMGVLVGIIVGLSRMAADSEVTAMRASGMGSGTFLRIVGVFALAAWLLATFNNTYVAPRSAAALAELQDRLKTSQASFEIQPRVFYEDFKNYVLYVQDSSASRGAAVWKGIFLADISNPVAPKITLAKQGVVTSEGENDLRLHLENGNQHESALRDPAQYSITTFQQTDIPIQLPVSDEKQSKMPPAAQLTTAQLLAESHHPDPVRARWFGVEFHRRFALSAACLALALVGIPLGLSARKGGKSTGFVLTILLVFLYYMVSLVGVSLGRQGKLPPWAAVWSANALFLLGGVLLLIRVDRMPIDIGFVRTFRDNFRRWRRRMAVRMRRTRGNGEARTFLRDEPRERVFGLRFPQILDNYILRDFLTYLAMLLVSFVGLVLIFTLFELIGDIIKNKVPALTVAEYVVMFTPSMVYQMTPLAVLLAVLITFGILEKGNEVTAMKATGISVYRIIVPVLAISFVVGLALFLFDQTYLPHANKRQDALWNAMKGKPAQTYLRPDRKWIFGQHSAIYYYEFYDPDRDQFGNFSAFVFDPETFQVKQRIFAARVHWAPEMNKWIFQQGWERTFQGEAIKDFRNFDATTFASVDEPPSYFRKEVRQSQEMNAEELRRYINDLQQSGFDTVRLRVQWHKKFAYPLITFVMAVLAVPFALSAGRKGALTGVAVAISIALVYWVTNGLFEAMGNVSQLPPALAAWAPNLLFGLIGGYLILKVHT